MQIYDSTSSKIREVKNVRIEHHTLPFIEDNKAIEKSVAGVAFTVVGDNHEWPNWIALDEFQQFNPNISLDEIKAGVH